VTWPGPVDMEWLEH